MHKHTCTHISTQSIWIVLNAPSPQSFKKYKIKLFSFWVVTFFKIKMLLNFIQKMDFQFYPKKLYPNFFQKSVPLGSFFITMAHTGVVILFERQCTNSYPQIIFIQSLGRSFYVDDLAAMVITKK